VPSLVDGLRRHRVRTPSCVIHPGNPPAFRSSKLQREDGRTALSTRSLSQIISCTSAYLYHVSRQGAPCSTCYLLQR
jgi:hypothetical protein